jgi:hypothetical protein
VGDDDLEEARARNSFWVSVVALGVLLAAFLIAVLALRGASNPGEAIAAAMGVVGTTIGTLAGLVAGKQAGESGKDAAVKAAGVAKQETDRTKAQNQILAGKLSPDDYSAVMLAHGDLFAP